MLFSHGSLPQPADDPEADHSIHEILAIRNPRGHWQCKVKFVSDSGCYEDMEDWADFEPVLQDTKPEPDSELEESILVTFIRQGNGKKHVDAAKHVAKLLGASFEEVFPNFAVLVPQAPKKKKREKTEPTALEEIPKYSEYCHDVGTYIPLGAESLWYFGEDRKYSEAKCLKCQKYYATAKNKSLGRKAELSLPTGHNVVYACPGMKSDKCCCGHLICIDCFATTASTGRRKCRTKPTPTSEPHLFI